MVNRGDELTASVAGQRLKFPPVWAENPIVEFTGGDTHKTHYLRQPFTREPDFGVTSVNYDFADLLSRSKEPT